MFIDVQGVSVDLIQVYFVFRSDYQYISDYYNRCALEYQLRHSLDSSYSCYCCAVGAASCLDECDPVCCEETKGKQLCPLVGEAKYVCVV